MSDLFGNHIVGFHTRWLKLRMHTYFLEYSLTGTFKMPYRHIVDAAGDKLRILDIDGYFAPTFDALSNHEAEVRSIPDWKCRPDDVYICAYPKAGM